MKLLFGGDPSANQKYKQSKKNFPYQKTQNETKQKPRLMINHGFGIVHDMGDILGISMSQT